MKVLFIFYVPSGGVETLNRQRSIALKEVGITCHFLYYENRRNYINEHYNPVFIKSDEEEIITLIKKHQYDAIVITSDFKMVPAIKKSGYNGKIFVEIQGYGSIQQTRYGFSIGKTLAEKDIDGFLNPRTPHISTLLSEMFPNVPKYEFNNCFDCSHFNYKATGKSFVQPIIGWVGRIEDNKNWQEFLNICFLLKRKLRNQLQVYLFEDPTLSFPKDRENFLKTMKKYHLEKNINLLPNIPNEKMADYFSMISDSGGFLCSTSKIEGAPLTALEAMSCRCPILTTDSSGIRTAVTHNVTGKYYDIGNPKEAVKEGIELIQNQTLRQTIINNAVSHVKTNFAPSLYAQNFKKMMTSTLPVSN